MAFDWKKSEESMVGEPVPTGWHQLTIAKVIASRKGGERLTSKNGDPQIMLVFCDEMNREVMSTFTLSDKAVHFLAKLMARCGMDLAKLSDEGIEPKHFAKKELAEKYLVGRFTWAEVKYEKGSDGKEYGRVTPVYECEVPIEDRGQVDMAQNPQDAKPIVPADDLPF